MRGWIVLAAVLLLLFLLGQLRLGAVGEYGPGGAGAWFRAGPVRIRLYPRRRSGPSKKEKAPKPGKEHPAGEARGGGLLELMKELLPLALEADFRDSIFWKCGEAHGVVAEKTQETQLSDMDRPTPCWEASGSP